MSAGNPSRSDGTIITRRVHHVVGSRGEQREGWHGQTKRAVRIQVVDASIGRTDAGLAHVGFQQGAV